MKNNQIPILILLLILIGSALFWNTTLAPLRDEVNFMRGEHELERIAAEDRIRQGEIATAQYDALLAEVEADEATYQAFLETLPTSTEAGELINQITEAAAAAGVTINEINPNHQEEPLGLDVIASTTNIISTGTYDQVHEFLALIENLPRSSRLTRVAMNADRNEWNNPPITITLGLETHVYRSGGQQ